MSDFLRSVEEGRGKISQNFVNEKPLKWDIIPKFNETPFQRATNVSL